MVIHCPNRDGLLKRYTTTGKNGLPVSYHRCPHCRGFWLTGFAANFIRDITESPSSRETHSLIFHPACPECNTPLTHTRADALAPGVAAWHCPHGHGYFFPAGELSKFKSAQTAKLTYHKLWNIPLASVANVLLASLAILLFSITAVVTAIRQKQNIQLQAQQILQSQRAIVTTQGAVTFVTSTNLPAVVTLFVEVEPIEPITMETQDGLAHTATVSTMLPGTYTYYFLIERSGERSITEKFTISL